MSESINRTSETVEDAEPDWNAAATREAARRFAAKVAAIEFPTIGAPPRTYDAEELMGVVIVAFEHGADWESRR